MPNSKVTKDNITIVIFGAAGDLTQRKLVPALFRLFQKKRLPKNARVVGFARRDWDDDAFRDHLVKGMKETGGGTPPQDEWTEFARRIRFFSGDLEDSERFKKLDEYLNEMEQGDIDRLYYLAVPPGVYTTVVNDLGDCGMADPTQCSRNIVIEKPFGHDLESAQELNRAVHKVFAESQVYRIDHYLGKETAQNLMFLRFSNAIFEPIWNRRYVDNVQITVVEEDEVGHRGGYYDKAGVLRDMFQNHLLQLLTLIAMEPPASFDADSLRNEKVKILHATRPIELKDTVQGQYNGYRDTDRVAPDSKTATYGALKLFVDTWRWKGVPFYLRSGKALARKTTQISVVFQCPPLQMFDLSEDCHVRANVLSICIQPNEGVHLKFETKVPDSAHDTRSVDMEFLYRESFEGQALPDAYERLLLDAMKGDASLFARNDEIEAAWKLMDPVIAGWQSSGGPDLYMYERGGWGPKEADMLLARHGHIWRLGCNPQDGNE